MNQSKHVIFCNFVLDREIHMWALWCGEYYRTKVSINFSPPLLSKVTERQCCCLSRHRFKCCTIVSEKSSKSSTSRIKFSRNCKYNEMLKESITKLQVCASWWHFSDAKGLRRKASFTKINKRLCCIHLFWHHQVFSGMVFESMWTWPITILLVVSED